MFARFVGVALIVSDVILGIFVYNFIFIIGNITTRLFSVYEHVLALYFWLLLPDPDSLSVYASGSNLQSLQLGPFDDSCSFSNSSDIFDSFL